MVSASLLNAAARGIYVVLLGALVVLVGLTVERVITFIRWRNRLAADAATLEEMLDTARFDAALDYFSKRDSVAARVVHVALRYAKGGPVAVEKATGGALLLMRERLERGLTVLATLGNNAPFIGLLGTVLGIVAAFHSLGENADTRVLMGAISEALIATAVGLGVALPAVIAYNYCQKRVDSLLVEAEALSSLVVARVAAGGPDGGAPRT